MNRNLKIFGFKDIISSHDKIVDLKNQINDINKNVKMFINEKLSESLIGKVITSSGNDYFLIKNLSVTYTNMDDYKFMVHLTGVNRYMSDNANGELGFYEETQRSERDLSIQIDISNEKIIYCDDIRFINESSYNKFMEAFNKRCQIADKNGKPLSAYDDVEFIYDGKLLKGTLSNFYDVRDNVLKVDVIAHGRNQEMSYYVKCTDCKLVC